MSRMKRSAAGRLSLAWPMPESSDARTRVLKRDGIDKTEQTALGFRAIARTLLEEVKGYPIEWIEKQLAHEVRDPNGRAYNRTAFLSQRRQMMQDWSNYLDELRENGP